MNLQFKICGIKKLDNMIEILHHIAPDYMGMIFYKKSPRYVGNKNIFKSCNFGTTKKVGVFVNTSIDEILFLLEEFNLDVLQLHGEESVQFCEKLKNRLKKKNLSTKIMKTFSIKDEIDNFKMDTYSFCDYFLFDRQTKFFGGSGKRFPWHLLENYTLNTPFFLSGGIGREHFEEIDRIKNKQLWAIDVNSRFENALGEKNINELKKINTFFKPNG